MVFTKTKTARLIITLFAFLVGVHNIDTAQNLRYLNCELKDYDLTLFEKTAGFYNIAPEILYIIGIWLIIMSFFMVVFMLIYELEK